MGELLCLVCLGIARPGNKAQGDNTHVVCPRCGEYFISGTAAAIQKNQLEVGAPSLGPEGSRKRANASGFIRENRQKGRLDSADFEMLSALSTPAFHNRAERFILALEKETEFAGQFVQVDPVHWLGRTWCMNGDELNEVILSLEAQGFIEREQRVRSAGASPTIGFKISPTGWAYLGKLRELNPLSRQAFVAMWFHDLLTSLYDEFIAQAVRDSGYEPKRIDKKEYLGRIDDEIISEIRRSRFLVADFTGHRGGVYYEAGFAHGLNIPVIFTCRKKELGRLHFDVRQYVTIDWETPEDLRRRLQKRITSVLGWGPVTPSFDPASARSTHPEA